MDLKIASSSAWDATDIETYLQTTDIPLRLACNGKEGYPVLCSMWFQLTDNSLWCASHESSRVIAALTDNAKCAFEIASNEMPYRGVRGQADALLHREGAAAVLERLMARYLDDSNAALAAWLRGRASGEYAIELQPRWISAWDYRHRMRA